MWRDFEIDYLKKNYRDKTNHEISKVIKRSNKAIVYMAAKFGLRKNEETYCRAHKHTSVDISKKILGKMYLKEGKSIRRIAKEIGLGKNTVDYYLKKYKICKRTVSEANKNFYANGGKIWKTGLTKESDRRIFLATKKMKETLDKKKTERFSVIEKKFNLSLKDLINKQYWDNNLSQEQIAKKISLSREEIVMLMKEFGIPKRPNYRHISGLRGKDHSMYGSKWEDTYGLEKAKKLKAERSAWSRENIIRRLKNREMPFKETRIEKSIMKQLARRNISFISQFEIDNKFVCDIALPQYNLIIECDGDYWHANPKIYTRLNKIQKRKVQIDKFKDKYLAKKDWKVLRFFESDIKKSCKACIDKVEEQLKKVANPLDSPNNLNLPEKTQ